MQQGALYAAQISYQEDDINQMSSSQEYLIQNKPLNPFVKLVNHLISDENMPELIVHKFLKQLSPRQLNNIGLTSKQALLKISRYQDILMHFLLSSVMKMADHNLSYLVMQQHQAVDHLKSLKSPAYTLWTQQLNDQIKKNVYQENKCAVVLKGSPLNSYLNQTLLHADMTYQHLPGFVLYQQNDNCKYHFNQLFFAHETHAVYKSAVMQHLLSSMSIYAPKEKEMQKIALTFFWTNNKSVICHHFANIYKKSRYIQFSFDLTSDQLQDNHHIVITDDKMIETQNKDQLTSLLKANKNHQVVLEIGTAFIKNGRLNIEKTDLPQNISHLALTNTTSCATSIGDRFLSSNTTNLKSFNTAGLTNVTSIGDFFLLNTKQLTSFDTCGLTSVTSIGDLFLLNAKNLISFDTYGLTNVISIGNDFIYDAEQLTSFDTCGLTSVTSIGNNFLYCATSLKSFNTARLTNVRFIENSFLHGATSLKSFNTTGLINVRFIKDNFLFNTKNLVSFNTYELVNVISIGNNFLFNTKNLVSFDTCGLINLTSIGNNFLFNAENLASFDTSRLTSIKFVGKAFFNKALKLQNRNDVLIFMSQFVIQSREDLSRLSIAQ